jgi:hypothetical protein
MTGGADAAGIAGMEAALRKEAADWQRTYNVLAHAFLAAHPPGHRFIMEELRFWVRERGLPAPHHHNVWGAAARALLKGWQQDGRVVEDGRRAGTSSRAHGQAFRVYRKLP